MLLILFILLSWVSTGLASLFWSDSKGFIDKPNWSDIAFASFLGYFAVLFAISDYRDHIKKG